MAGLIASRDSLLSVWSGKLFIQIRSGVIGSSIIWSVPDLVPGLVLTHRFLEMRLHLVGGLEVEFMARLCQFVKEQQHLFLCHLTISVVVNLFEHFLDLLVGQLVIREGHLP